MALQFGVLVPQGWTMDLARIKDPVQAYETMTSVAQTAEAVGFAFAWFVDHFHTIPHPTPEVTFECWMSTAALARDTRNIRIGQMVTCNSYRHPALLAKMASTVDVLSHGRLNFGIGEGTKGTITHGMRNEFDLRSRTGVRASLMALICARGSRAVAPSTASDAVHNAVHGAFMTLPAYSSSREGEGHEPGFGVKNGSSTARSHPMEASRERMERSGEGPSAQGTARCASRGRGDHLRLGL